ncbi:MAG: glycosyltransferase family 4 protein [Proteobacteria bacterium]|nr:glycosyltransferase family 4 protein [Pseudomonadota bacterium]
MPNNLLVITTLYPNKIQYRHGIFVETRLRYLLDSGQVNAKVIAPVPWFPFKSKRFSEYAQYVDVPKFEQRNGIDIYHPRYLVIPKIGMLITPFFLALSILLAAKKVKNNGYRYDLIDCHYYYPDGIAVALISKFLGRPFTVTARGTDINLIPEFRLPRRLIVWASKKAAASITVCAALKERMAEIGAEAEKIHVLRNGVNLELFRPMDRERCKQQYQVRRTTLLSVGHLIERKGHDKIIKAMAALPDCDLLIAGGGELDHELKALVVKLGLSQQVRFLGELQQDQLPELYNAVDIMVLASSREGWANVLLESMACGTPVVATNIWGTPEVVNSPAAGVLVERTTASIAEGVRLLLENRPNPEDTRKYAEGFSWQNTVSGLNELFAILTTGDQANTINKTDQAAKRAE